MSRIHLNLLLMLLIVCNVNTYAQNINSAGNGLSKLNDSTVGMGGTLGQNTDIDLGGTFKMGYKKGSLSYLSILNNGNVGLGVANPLAQFHTSGSIRFDLFKNNAAFDSLITTDEDGNLIFRSVANFINASNGITWGAGGLKLGGILTAEETYINGNGKAFGMYDLLNVSFQAAGTATLQGASLHLGGNNASIALDNDGFSSISSNIYLENRDEFDSIMIVNRLGTGYAGMPIKHELKMNLDGLSLTRMGIDMAAPKETFLFGHEGRAYLRRYSDYNTDNNWLKFADGPTTKALYIDEATGMLKYGSILSDEGSGLNYLNGLTKIDSDVKLGGLLTDESTYIDGQSTNSLYITGLNGFSVSGNEMGLSGVNNLGLSGGGSAISINNEGLYGYSGENGGIKFKAPINRKISLSAQVDYSYGFTPVDNELWLDTSGINFMKTSPFLGDAELFRFGLDGKAYFRSYPQFLDAPTGKALYIDTLTGQVMYGDIMGGSSLNFAGGLINEEGRVRLGGTLDDGTQLLVPGDANFSILTEDDRLIGFSREEEGREWLVKLKNSKAELALQRHQLGLGVSDYESGRFSSINLHSSQINSRLSIDGGLQNSYITQNETGAIYIGTEVRNFENQLGNDVLMLDTTGFYFSVLDVPKFSIKTNGDAQMSNSAGGLFSLEGESARYGLYNSTNGNTALEISPGTIKLGHEPPEGGTQMAKLGLYANFGGAILQSSSFLSLRTGYMTNLNMDPANFDVLAPNYDFSATHNFRVGVNGLTFGVSQQTESGWTFIKRYLSINNDGKLFLENYRNNEAQDSVLTTDAEGNLIFKAISAVGGGGTDSAWAYDSVNIYNRNSGNVGIGTLIPTAKFHTLGSVRFESFKNNLQGDSVLTTDAEGNLRFVYMPYGSGGGGGEGYTFDNGIVQANGHVRLGGALTDSVKIDLAGYPFRFHDGDNKVIDIAANGNVGIGTAASGFKLTTRAMSVGQAYDSVGWGDRLWLGGNGNSDGVWMARYNTGADASELRVSISDDGGPGDKFHIGHFLWNTPGVWQSTFLVQANGTAGVGTNEITGEMSIGKTHGNKLTVGNNSWAKTGIITTGWDSNNDDYTDLLVPGAETNSAIIRLNKAGNVGIGTLAPDALYKLSVNGKIRAKGLRVQSTGWADFVFEPDYKLMSLPELEKFVRNKKHLPGIATAAKVMREGNDVGETQVQLLQKIEELTLYIIELNKQVKELEDKNKKLEGQQTQITQMQQQLDELRKLILNK